MIESLSVAPAGARGIALGEAPPRHVGSQGTDGEQHAGLDRRNAAAATPGVGSATHAEPQDEAAREVRQAKQACLDSDAIMAQVEAQACVQHATGLFSSDVDLADWDDLLQAVKGRLTRIVGESAGVTGPPAAGADAAALTLQDGVLDCVGALDQLQLTLGHELQRRGRIGSEPASPRGASLLPARAPGSRTASTVGPPRVPMADDATGLLRRARFREHLGRVMARRGSPRPVLAVLILGLADVTAIASTHGQGIGDELLRIVGARLVRALRAQDLITRLWSDEYACLLADVPSREQLGRLAGKLHDIVAAPIRLGTLELSMRPSIGISASPGDADNADSMLVCADVAMCRARHLNCSYAFFDAGLQAHHAPRLQA